MEEGDLRALETIFAQVERLARDWHGASRTMPKARDHEGNPLRIWLSFPSVKTFAYAVRSRLSH